MSLSINCVEALRKTHSNILLDFLYSNSIISPNQFGFLPSRSTTDALIAATQAISILELLIFFLITPSYFNPRWIYSPVCGVFLLTQVIRFWTQSV